MQECIHKETNAASTDMHADLSTGSILMCTDVLHVQGSIHTVNCTFQQAPAHTRTRMQSLQNWCDLVCLQISDNFMT